MAGTEFLFEILVNPLRANRPPLQRVGDYLVCTESGDGFPIVNGIPQLLPENVIPSEQLQALLAASPDSASETNS